MRQCSQHAGDLSTKHHTRAASCQPFSQNYASQPYTRTTCSSLSEISPCSQPCTPADGLAKPKKPLPASINNIFRTVRHSAEMSAEQPKQGSPQRQQVARNASVSMRARSQDPSRAASQLLACSALPDSILKGGFPKAISNRSALKQHDMPPIARRHARLHSRNSRQGSVLEHDFSLQPPPAFADLVQKPRQASAEAKLAFRSAVLSFCSSFQYQSEQQHHHYAIYNAACQVQPICWYGFSD